MGGRGGWKDKVAASIREVVFGLEDSFVSTMGAISGIAVGTGDRYVVILSGLVLVVVEAVSMAAGSYLSSKAARELYEERHRQDATRVLAERVSDDESLKELFVRKGFSKKEVTVALQAIGRERKLWLHEVERLEYRMTSAGNDRPLLAGSVMGVCYILGGILTLSPYFFFPLGIALPTAVMLTFVALFMLGFLKAKLAHLRPVRSGLEMVTVSLSAALIGIVIGRLASGLTNGS